MIASAKPTKGASSTDPSILMISTSCPNRAKYSWATRRNTVSSRYATVVTGDSLIPNDARQYPWNQKQLTTEDNNSSHAFVAEMDVTYRNTMINGIGLRANRPASQYNLIRIPATNLLKEQ